MSGEAAAPLSPGGGPPPFLAIGALFGALTEGQRVRIRGWVHRARSSGGILFWQVRDGSGLVQVTARRDALGGEAFDRAEHAQVESSVEVEGTLAADRRAPGGLEVRAHALTVVGPSEAFPLFADQTEEFRLDHRHLTVRSREMVATLKVKAELLRAAREFLDGEGYWEMTPPLLSGNAAEGGSEAFTLDYFGQPAYLAQTAQLYLEALLFPRERVYSITTSFRAEKSRTPRHLCEYTHLEAEVAWAGLEENLRLQEGLVAHMVHQVARKREEDLRFLGRDPKELLALAPPFERLRYEDAVHRLKERGFPVSFGMDLGTAEERALTQERSAPLFVTHYPRAIKAFYMREDPEDPRTVLAADLLAPEGYGELIGGSCREVDLPRLLRRMEEMNIPREPYEWYLDLRRYGSVPHAGFGLGVERVVRWVTRREHIRDTTPFPRTPSRLVP
jgi:asparaginyl-tRNA synthetase